MRKNVLLTVVLAAALLISLSFAPSTLTQAQDAMIVCDADVILSLYIAEYYFGYGALNAMMMKEGEAMKDDQMMGAMVDVSKFDKGQFAPLFDSMMSMMGENMMTPGGIKIDEAMMQKLSEAMKMDAMGMMKEMMPGTDMSKMTTLVSAVIPNEPQECTALRASLNQFYTALALQNVAMAVQK